jgi:integrase
MRDPLASRPFVESDIRRVLEVADRYVVVHRDRGEDPQLAGRLIRLMLVFGPHISVLSGGMRWRKGKAVRYDSPLSSSDLRREGGQLSVAWRRPKTGTGIMIPVPDDIAPWLGEFLDRPRWTRRASYNELLNRMYPRTEGGLVVTPSRFRHTAAVRLRKMGLLDEDVQDMLGIAPQTMRHYINRTYEDRTRDLKSRGWDHSTLS